MSENCPVNRTMIGVVPESEHEQLHASIEDLKARVVKLEAHLKVHHRIEFRTDDCQLAEYAKGD